MRQRLFSPIHFPFLLFKLAVQLCLLVLLLYVLSVSPPIKLASKQTDCVARVRSVREKLENINSSESCVILDQGSCDARFASAVDDATPDSVFKRSATCDIMWPWIGELDQEERDFPLGFYITVYTDARNLEILLSTIFRRHNSYCIHVDPKADSLFISTVRQLLSCYQGRYLKTFISASSRSTPVYWGHISIVEAEMICLSDLLKADTSWKYAVNLAGSEMMLVTNKQLVQKLKSWEAKGTVFSVSNHIALDEEWRFRKKHKLNPKGSFDPEFQGNFQGIMIEDSDAPDPVPFQLNIYKGIKSHRLPRSFVNFLLNHPVAKTFYDWSTTTFIPDEMVVPTLARISFMNLTSEGWKVEQGSQPHYPDHLQHWQGGVGHTCLGSWRHSVCVFSLEDLPTLLQSRKHIANKFRSDFDPLAVECLADLLKRRNW